MVDIDLNETTNALKSKIRDIEGIPVYRQRFAFAGYQLADDTKLRNYGLERVILVLTTRLCMCTLTGGRVPRHTSCSVDEVAVIKAQRRQKRP